MSEFFGNFSEFSGNSLGIVWGCIVWGFWFGIFLWIRWDFFWNFVWILWEFQIANADWHKVVNVTWIEAIFDLRRDKDRTNQILRSTLARSRLKRLSITLHQITAFYQNIFATIKVFWELEIENTKGQLISKEVWIFHYSQKWAKKFLPQ